MYCRAVVELGAEIAVPIRKEDQQGIKEKVKEAGKCVADLSIECGKGVGFNRIYDVDVDDAAGEFKWAGGSSYYGYS